MGQTIEIEVPDGKKATNKRFKKNLGTIKVALKMLNLINNQDKQNSYEREH